MTMQGTRLPDAVMGEPGAGWEAWESATCVAGSYMKVTSRRHDGTETVRWYIKDPLGDIGSITSRRFSVVEHENGTITVAPSIDNKRQGDDSEHFADIRDGRQGWHGWLERDAWRSC